MTKENKYQSLIKRAEEYYQEASQLTKIAYIRKLPNGKYRVFSEKGKNMGTYNTREGAKKRLRQVEFFKHKKASYDDGSLDLSKLEDVGYSSIMREINKKGDDEMMKCFLSLYKQCFDHSVLQGESEEGVLPKTLVLFSKHYDLHLPKK